MPFTIASAVCSFIGIASIFTPLAPVVTGPCAVYVIGNTGYEAIKSSTELYYKYSYGWDMKNLDSFIQVLKVVSLPLNIATGIDLSILDKDNKESNAGKLKILNEILNNVIDLNDFFDEFGEEILYKIRDHGSKDAKLKAYEGCVSLGIKGCRKILV